MRYKASILLLSLFLAGCGNSNTGSTHFEQTNSSDAISSVEADSLTPSHQIIFEKIFSIHDSDSLLIGTIGGSDVDDNGNIYFGDGKTIKVFDKNGDYVSSLGRAGRGPGEFTGLGSLAPIIRDTLIYVFDYGLIRLNVFSTNSFDLVRTVTFDMYSWSHIPEISTIGRPTLENVLIDGSLILKFKEGVSFRNLDDSVKTYYYRFSGSEKRVSNELASGIESALPIARPFDRFILLDVSKTDNTLFTAYSDRFSITVNDTTGSPLSSFFYDYKPAPFDKDDYITQMTSNSSAYKSELQNQAYPETWPVINTFLVDDENRIWISTITEEKDRFKWWIFDIEGNLIATFHWPGSRLKRHLISVNPEINVIKESHLYVTEIDDETGIQKLSKYQFSLQSISEQ